MSDTSSEPSFSAEPELSDDDSRRADLARIWMLSASPLTVAIVTDIEGGLILESAFASYRHGVDVAAIITAHASCERDLLIRAARWQEHGEPEPPARYERWGLGGLLNHYRAELPSDLFVKLEELNVRRRTLYHYGHSDGATGVRDSTFAYVQRVGRNQMYDAYTRRHDQIPDQKELLDFAMDAMLREHALKALEAAIAARSWAIR